MATVKLNQKSNPLLGNTRRQTTWIRSEEKLKQWRKGSTNQTARHTTRNSGTSSNERKSDVTRSGRLSDGTIHSSSTGSSSEPGLNFRRLQDVDDIEQKESIEKCLKWMENLPEKFSEVAVEENETTGNTKTPKTSVQIRGVQMFMCSAFIININLNAFIIYNSQTSST